jgi:hypothetical protein
MSLIGYCFFVLWFELFANQEGCLKNTLRYDRYHNPQLYAKILII